MYIKTISASYQKKWNTGNYTSLELSASAWADLADNEDPVRAQNELAQHCREAVWFAFKNREVPPVEKTEVTRIAIPEPQIEGEAPALKAGKERMEKLLHEMKGDMAQDTLDRNIESDARDY